MADSERSEWAENWPLLLAAIVGIPVPVAMTYLLGQFPPTIETNGALAGRLSELLLYGLGPDDVNEFAARVTAVDAAAAKRTIGQAFPVSRNRAIVLVGDAARIREQVGKYGPVTEMKITDLRFTPATK